MHGFLLLKESDGKLIAVGDMVQIVHGKDIRSRLVFHFRDGSEDDDTTVLRQGRTLEFVSDHHIQSGPSFPKPMDMTISAAKSEVSWKEFKDGKAEVKTEHVDLPDNLANGMVPLVLETIASKSAETTVSYVVAAPKPRVVKLTMKPEGKESYRVGGVGHRATKYQIHIELGGVAGVIAPIIGKQPSDIHIWVADGEAPIVVRIEGALYEGGPIWTMTETSPVWSSGKE